MSGLPQLTEAMWAESLAAAVEARPSHISVYDLQASMMCLLPAVLPAVLVYDLQVSYLLCLL